MKSATNNGLKHARLNKKLSISELAIAINKDTSTIHLWEDGLKAIDSLILEQFDYSLVIAPVVAELCTTSVALSAPPNSYQNNSQS